MDQTGQDDVAVTAPNLSRLDTDLSPSPRPPMLQSFTERPAARQRASLFNRKRAPTADRVATHVAFDPSLSSDSESSSEDEEEGSAHGGGISPLSPIKKKTADSKKHSQERQQRERSGTGPFSTFKIANENFKTKGRVSGRDGRLRISIHEAVNSGYFAKTFGAGLKKRLRSGEDDEMDTNENIYGKDHSGEARIPAEEDPMEDPKKRMKLNICVIVIGSRGDIQPFIRIARILQDDYGHRVRVATHPAFREFVENDAGLEFFSIGGDPAELMAFMVKNPGLVPSMDTIREGEIGRRRAAMAEMFKGMWRACINTTDDEKDVLNMKMMGDKEPFIVDAIIANPPSFAPPHIAECLGVPLHMMFTFPYTPTTQFPHPLANIKSTNVDNTYTNFMSYPLVEMMTWQGLGDLINDFRSETLGLDEVYTLWAPGQLYRLQVPYTYLWSPSLVPKPKDWGPEISLSGFVFLELASKFKPPPSLVKFLEAGSPPVYIGFGSIVVDDPDRFTRLIFEAVKIAGVRALVSKGWGKLGDGNNTPDNIYMLDNTPHDWLFPRVSAVVHHGGAGTTAIGLKCAKPTMIVPFFGDQPFWGAMVAKAKAGAHECIPYKKLTAERFAEGIKQCLSEEARVNVKKIAESIEREGDGALNAVRAFHKCLPLDRMHCQVLENRPAAWHVKRSGVRLSPLAAELLVETRKLKWNDLRLLRHCEWNDFGGPGEPITGAWGALIGTVKEVTIGMGSVPVNVAKEIKEQKAYHQKKHRLKLREKQKKKTQALNAENSGNQTSMTPIEATATDPSSASTPAPLSPVSEIEIPAPLHRTTTTLSTLTPPPTLPVTRSFFRSALLPLLASPFTFTHALTLGFHNAPRLYGDSTVRPIPRITGIHSGVRAARREFVHGVVDGFSGLYVFPRDGAKDGVRGFFRGVGMGVGGVVLKTTAGGFGVVVWTGVGIKREAERRGLFGERGRWVSERAVRRGRVREGGRELVKLRVRRDGETDEERRMRIREVEVRVVRRWDEILAKRAQERNAKKRSKRSQSKNGKGGSSCVREHKSSVKEHKSSLRARLGFRHHKHKVEAQKEEGANLRSNEHAAASEAEGERVPTSPRKTRSLPQGQRGRPSPTTMVSEPKGKEGKSVPKKAKTMAVSGAEK